jgi:hypothetical protein
MCIIQDPAIVRVQMLTRKLLASEDPIARIELAGRILYYAKKAKGATGKLAKATLTTFCTQHENEIDPALLRYFNGACRTEKLRRFSKTT